MQPNSTPLDYSGALTAAMTHAAGASSVWFNHANNMACRAIALRSAEGPIYCADAAFMTTLMPLSFLLDTTPLSSDGTLASMAQASGLQDWYWFYATLGSASVPSCSVVVSVTRVTIHDAARVSAWVLHAAFSESGAAKGAGGAWRREAPVYLDDAHVRIDGARGRVVITHPRVRGHVSATSTELHYVPTGVKISAQASSVRGLVRPTHGGNTAALSHIVHVSDWGMVDGSITSASITMPSQLGSKAPHKHLVYHAGDGKAWFSRKSIGVARVSRFRQFLMSMFSRNPMVVKFVSLRMQTHDLAIEVFLPDAKSIDALSLNRHVRCAGVATVWKHSRPDTATRALTAALTIAEVHAGRNLPSVLLVEIAGVASLRVSAQAAPAPLEMHDINSTRFISVMDVTVDGSHHKIGEGMLEWVPGVSPRRSEVIHITGVDSAVITASFAGNPHARAALGLGLAALVLVYVSLSVLLLTFVYTLLRQRRR